jgi:hypothetical protein
MPTRAAPGARMNVVIAEVKLLRNLITSLLQKPAWPARLQPTDRRGALVDVNAYGALVARAAAFSASRIVVQVTDQIAGSTARDM